MNVVFEGPKDAFACYVVAHGAGAGMKHPFLAAIAKGFAERGVATLRYEFPYMERGSRRPDTPSVAKARVRDTELQVWQNVEQSYLNLGEAEERIGAAQKAVESAEENYQLARGRFDAGVANIIELTDAQLALTQAQSDQAQALSDYRIGIARLERALGRR